MKNVHVRFEYQEALNGKKQLLSSQMNFLQLLKRVKSYKVLRKSELILKSKVKKELKELKTEIENIQIIFSPEEIGEVKIEKKHKERESGGSIESQLREIQEKLARLQ